MTSTQIRRLITLGCIFYCFDLLQARPGETQTFFIEVTRETGIQPWGSRAAPIGDYDNDGWPDLFRSSWSQILYHNEGNSRFTDHTLAIQSELTPRLKGGGSIFGDYDNDGDLDLFVPVGAYIPEEADQNILLRNDQGIFHDVAMEAGLIDSLHTDNAVWFDYDRDGYLDLYLGNPGCGTLEQPVFNLLYHNRGDGCFEDVTEQVGLKLQLGSTAEGGCGGGSNGGMAAGDFNDDGWPDLHLTVFKAPNRLFLNDGQGHFQDATTTEIADPSEAFGVAVGDIDNDGDLDIFQAAGGNDDTGIPFRSPLLLNLGEGQFLDVTEAVGLGGLIGHNILIATLGDIDNDGDLDLLTGSPHFLYLNNGDGTFVDQTSQSGMTENIVSSYGFGDYDLDGFLDAWDGQRLFHNNTTGNHYLRIELVGVESNRSGIGARLSATAGELRQMREILGGFGYNQDELVAHFGLGQHTKVDHLEIRWPSGQVDVLTDIPADQKIRIFEGREGYHPIAPTAWAAPPPDSLVAGSTFNGEVAVRPALLEAEADVTAVVADLSEMGGPSTLPLQTAGDGTWRANVVLDVPEIHGFKTIPVMIDQSTSLGDYWTKFSRTLQVLPAEDHVVFTGDLGGNWQLGAVQNDAVQKLGFISLRNGQPELEVIDADGKNRMRLTHAAGIISWKPDGFGYWQHNWDWSPDGTRIVFATDWDGPLAIYVMDVDGTDLRQLTYPLDSQFDMQPAWSPDGAKIAFTSTRQPGITNIFVVDADGGNPVRLTDIFAVDGNPVWSPDGTKIAFARFPDSVNEGNNSEIYVMNADGSNPVRLTDSPHYENNPSWSPDGAKIAFLFGPIEEGQPQYDRAEIYVMDADGTNSVNISNNEVLDWNSTWSPDGTKIAFNSAWGNEIKVVNADGSGPIQSISGGGYNLPLWLPAGASSPGQVLNSGSPSMLHQGKTARKLQAEKIWMTSYESDLPIDPIGYRGVGFAFHPGDAELPEEGWLKIRINQKQIDLLDQLDIGHREWQEVEIPVAEFAQEGPVGQIEFSGSLKGTFYLADIRLVTSARDRPATAVTEEQIGLPGTFTLRQNYPNPFNGATVIRFALPATAGVDLVVFNLAGQRVATLVEGMREAGTYTIRWDGRDDDGRALASGVYLYRLRVGDGQQVETRKLALIR